MGAQSGYTAEGNTIDLPSGGHLSLPASVPMDVSFLALVVAPVALSKSASQICCEPSRLEVNRMRLPSGANWGPPSPGWVTAIFFGSPPLMCCIHSSGVLEFLSRSTVVTEYASHLPSGEKAVSPSRFMLIRSSNAMGRFASAERADWPKLETATKTNKRTEQSLCMEFSIRVETNSILSRRRSLHPGNEFRSNCRSPRCTENDKTIETDASRSLAATVLAFDQYRAENGTG